MEQPHNEEGIKNHHYSDGSNFISRSGKEYFDIFPVWDWLKIPGATITQDKPIPHWNQLAKKGRRDFVGAVTDGTYGVAAMDLRCVHDSLEARKAWFFFDKEYVCLGAGIRTTENLPVATTLNQCLLNKDVFIKANNKSTALEKGKHNLQNVSWVNHDSVAYIFPSPVSVNVHNTTATGTWRSINHQAWATEETVSKETFTLWIDHGIQPQAGSYAYIIVPGIDPNSSAKYAEKNDVVILINNDNLQAVTNKALNISYAVFYQPGSIRIDKDLELSVDKPCVVMIKRNAKGIEKLAVADPTQKLVSLKLTSTLPLVSKNNASTPIRINGKDFSEVNIDLPKGGDAGKSVIIE